MSTTAAAVERGAYVSALDLFSIGIGPSSSHTVGPMRAAKQFREMLDELGLLARVTRFECVLHGSLAATGVGHGTPDAVVAGLRGYDAETIDPDLVHGQWSRLESGQELRIDHVDINKRDITFEPRARHHGHPNALTLRAEIQGDIPRQQSYLSIGGGFIIRAGETTENLNQPPPSGYRTMTDLLAAAHGRSIAEIAWLDEVAAHGAESARAGLDRVWQTMRASIERGLATDGVLPGRLAVPRRAAAAWRALERRGDPYTSSESLSLYAMAVNEENASGSRVVTAPTNGAAGVLPAVLYDAVMIHKLNDADIHRFLLTATAVGSIIKANASISGAEGGCQAEVGSACAMAAAGLTAVRGGTNLQIENAAEIAIEHHLGLTCDPVGGLVQIPCIERNAVAAATALTASRLALLGNGSHVVGFDTIVEVMRQTGTDMSSRYKETSEAGLAVNVVEC